MEQFGYKFNIQSWLPWLNASAILVLGLSLQHKFMPGYAYFVVVAAFTAFHELKRIAVKDRWRWLFSVVAFGVMIPIALIKIDVPYDVLGMVFFAYILVISRLLAIKK